MSRTQVLQQFMMGQISEREAGPLEDHVLHCAKCAQAVTLLNASDTLLEAVRGSAKETNIKDDRVKALIKRLEKLRPTVLPPGAGATKGPKPAGVDTTPPDSSSAPSDGTQVVYDFLAAPQAPDELGRLGHYRVLKVLGIGGMGVVFQAQDPHLERMVALKVMLPALASNPSARVRFLREARAAAAIEHDHIVHMNQVGEEGGVPFLATPLLKGGMPLAILECNAAKVQDLTPLKGLPLKELRCDFRAERDADILRSIKTLEKINDKPVAEFWKEVGAAKGR